MCRPLGHTTIWIFVWLFAYLCLFKFSCFRQYRTIFYLYMSALRETAVQRLGIVIVAYMLDEYQVGFDHELRRKLSKVVSSLPVRIVAIYFVFQDNVWTQVVDVASRFLSGPLRLRARTIVGMCPY